MIEEKIIEEALIQFANKLEQPFLLKGIFFDMDGVLFDSMPLHAKAWFEAFEKYNIHLTNDEPYMNEGSTALYTVEMMFKKYLNKIPSAEITEKIRRDKHALMAKLPNPQIMQPMPQLLQIMSSQNIDCWVVTGSAQEKLLNRIEEEYPGILLRRKMISAHDVKIGKPHPEPYLIGMKKSGLNPNNSIVIENAPLGIQSAKAAGLFTIAINTGPLDPQILKSAGADLVLSGSAELLKRWPQIYKVLTNSKTNKNIIS